MSIIRNEVDLRIIELERQLEALKCERAREKEQAENPMVVRLVPVLTRHTDAARVRLGRTSPRKWDVVLERSRHDYVRSFDGRVIASVYESAEVARITAEAFARHFKVRFVG